MRSLIANPIFVVGLAIRLGLIAVVVPQAAARWYAPFLDLTTSAGLLYDPWAVFLGVGGAPEAFPYGYVMWFVLLPGVLISKLIGISALKGYMLTLLAADCTLLVLLNVLFGKPHQKNLLLLLYWLSPIPLLATYWLGLNDVIPVAMLGFALLYANRLDMFRAGLFCGAAVSAKLSMVLAIPVFLVYLLRNAPLRSMLPAYIGGVAVTFFAFAVPFLFSTAGMGMLMSNPELGKVYQFALSVGPDTAIYVLPLSYILMLYAAWRVRRLNFELFNALLGLTFLLVVLLTSASPGWFIWVMPFLVSYQLRGDAPAIALVCFFSAIYAFANLIASPLPMAPFGAELAQIKSTLMALSGSRGISLLHTVMTAVGIVLIVRIWHKKVLQSDFFRLSRKPLVIGIAGDSGAGKDTLAHALTGLFGKHSVTAISGDDYHLWDRHKPMWQVMTHLNPMANDLESFSRDVVALTDRKSIVSRHYDHSTGKMSRPVRFKSRDFVIASGLHALYMPILRNCYDLSIYLDIDEDLRRYLKIKRDVNDRGHHPEKVLESMERREPDADRFVRPQREHADLIMSLRPVDPRMLEDTGSVGKLRYKLNVHARTALNEASIARVLIGISGLHVDIQMGHDATSAEMTIEGDAACEDVAMAAQILLPQIEEFLDVKPEWRDGTLGLMQLITLSYVSQALHKRLI